jgi:hypothetical protein
LSGPPRFVPTPSPSVPYTDRSLNKEDSMTAPKDVAEIVTDELLVLRQKIQSVLADGTRSFPDAQDAYVSALIGHLFATLLTGFGPGPIEVDQTPEGLARALNTIAKKVGVVADSLDRTANYRIQIFRREKGGPEP